MNMDNLRVDLLAKVSKTSLAVDVNMEVWKRCLTDKRLTVHQRISAASLAIARLQADNAKAVHDLLEFMINHTTEVFEEEIKNGKQD